jgi:acyl-CoA synthetase (NDP forming)
MPIQSLMTPRSVAILGASDRPSIGRAIMNSLSTLGFPGEVYPINPKYGELLGRTCYPSIAELPAAPDVVAFCVGSARVLAGIEQCAQRKAGAAVIYDAGFAEQGEEGRALQRKITALCREAGVSLCGPNGMGVLNTHGRSSTYMQEVRDITRLPGNVGLISQSGSICIAMLLDVRRFGFSHVVSAGNEAVVTAAEYLDYLVADPDTAIIAMFLESIREPERFVAGLDRAADAAKPVVVIKVGQSQRAQQAVSTHTGGLAGESRVFSEVLRAHRAIEVSDLDEMAEVLAAGQCARKPNGTRAGVVTASGGKAELILDLVADASIELPPLSKAALQEATQVIGHFAGDGNPLDAWGNGDFTKNFTYALELFNESPDHDVVVLSSDGGDGNPMGHSERELRYAKLLADVARGKNKPYYLMGMRSSLMDQSVVDFLNTQDIPVLGGTRQALGAITKLATARKPRPAPLSAGRERRALAEKGGRRSVNELDAKVMLGAAGVPVCRERPVESAVEAIVTAKEFGFPVVLKVAADDILHKSEHGLVAVGLGSADLDQAWQRMQTSLVGLPASGAARRFVVQEMVTGGIEVFAGVKRNADFGLVLAFGLGGIAVEITNDVVLRMLPLREGDAYAMVAAVRAAALLRGARAKQPFDIPALVDCIEQFARFAWSERDFVEEIDINPIIVLPAGHGCKVVDALIIPRSPESKDG